LAHPDQPQRPLTDDATDDTPATAGSVASSVAASAVHPSAPPESPASAAFAKSRFAHDVTVAALVGIGTCVLLLVIYLAFAVPGA
jgi:hypothetical protein